MSNVKVSVNGGEFMIGVFGVGYLVFMELKK